MLLWSIKVNGQTTVMWNDTYKKEWAVLWNMIMFIKYKSEKSLKKGLIYKPYVNDVAGYLSSFSEIVFY